MGNACAEKATDARSRLKKSEASLFIITQLANCLDEGRLGLGTKKLDFIVDHDLRNSGHTVALRHIRELADLYNVGDDLIALDCHLVGHTGHAGTVRSRRRDEDLDMNILRQGFQ